MNQSKSPFKTRPIPSLYRFRFRLRRLSRHFRHVAIHRAIIFVLATYCAIWLFRFFMHHDRAPTSTQLTIGVSRVDITPTEPVWLAGFSSRDHAPEHSQLLHPHVPLTARALALRAGNATLVFVSIDVVALPRNLSDTMYINAFRRFGLTKATLRICATHTHSGPVVADSLLPLSPSDNDNVARIKRYELVLHNAVLRAIDSALARRTAVAMHFTRALAGLAVNRRQVPESGFLEGHTPRGVTDDSVPVLVFLEPKTRAIVAGICGYAAHATVLTKGYRYSGDYPGMTVALLEKRFSDSTWLFLTGCAGDQNIYPRGGVRWLLRHARVLAAAVIDVVEKGNFTHVGRPSDVVLTAQYTRIDLPFANRYSRRDLKRKGAGGVTQRRAMHAMMHTVGSDELTSASYSYPIAVWRVGDLVFAFLGGEPTVGYKALLTSLGVDWVVGYSEEVMGYVGTKEVILSGGREGGERAAWYYGLPSAWSTRVQNIIVSAVGRLVKDGIVHDRGHNLLLNLSSS